jgi:hypothetical protein
MAQGERRLLIDGDLMLADSGKTVENVDPATEKMLGDVADASAAEMQRAIAAAHGPSKRPTRRPTAPSGRSASTPKPSPGRRVKFLPPTFTTSPEGPGAA